MVTYRAWAIVIFASIAIHLAFAVGFDRPTSLGEVEKAAGAPTSVSGSLADVLGSAVPIQEAQPETTDAAEPVEEIKAVDALAARSQSVDPIALEATEDLKPLEEFQELKVTELTPPKPKPKKKIKPKKTKKEKAKKKSKKRAANKKPVGGKKKGASGKSRGGKGGKKRASAGAVRSYGSRVRAKILRNRPRGSAKGRAVISFGVSKSGGLRYARVRSGSGAAASAALRAVRRSAPFPRPPAGATNSQLNFSIAFTFR